jgi:hypothetical protein
MCFNTLHFFLLELQFCVRFNFQLESIYILVSHLIKLGQHWNNGNPGVNNNWRERTDIQTEEQTPKGKGGRKGKGKGFNNNGYNSKNSFNSKDSRISRENSKENSKVSEDKPSKEKS